MPTKSFKAAVLPIHLNVIAVDGHVGEVERSIRPIKERVRACGAHGLPYRCLPKIMIRHMVADVTRCLNQFPRKNGILQTLSPTVIGTGHARPDYNTMKIEFGAYAQVFDDHYPTNTPAARSIGAIALDPTGNVQGAYNFISFATGARISRHHWTELPIPIPDTAIARVEALALHEKQPLLQRSGLVVEWRHDQAIDDAEYDLDYDPPTRPDAESDALPFETTTNSRTSTNLLFLMFPSLFRPLPKERHKQTITLVLMTTSSTTTTTTTTTMTTTTITPSTMRMDRTTRTTLTATTRTAQATKTSSTATTQLSWTTRKQTLKMLTTTMVPA